MNKGSLKRLELSNLSPSVKAIGSVSVFFISPLKTDPPHWFYSFSLGDEPGLQHEVDNGVFLMLAEFRAMT